MLQEISLHGKVALITGGGSGIGMGIAKEMHDAGAYIIILGRREDILRKAVQEIGERTVFYTCDLTKQESMIELINTIDSDMPIDILVNNAGINIKKPFIEVEDEDFDEVIAIQVKAVFMLTREVAKKMIARRTGSIIMISSLSANIGMSKNQVYSMSKGGIVSLTRSLMVELAPFGIRVNSINPGYVLTDMVKKINVTTPERLQKMQENTPLKRFGSPKDIGMAAAFIASDAASFITGVDLVVDGGISHSSMI